MDSAWPQIPLPFPWPLCLYRLHADAHPHIKQVTESLSYNGRGLYVKPLSTINTKLFSFLNSCNSDEAEEI